MNSPEIESLLRSAPSPAPSARLRLRLHEELRTRSAAARNGGPAVSNALPGHWFRRWWPTLVLGGAGLATAAALWVQRQEFTDLQAQLSSQAPSAENQPATGDTGMTSAKTVTSKTGAAPALVEDERAEITRLRAEAAQLRQSLAAADTLAAENRALSAQVAAQAGFTQEEAAAMDAARDRAESIRCINNLKNIGLALRIWATDNGGKFPADLLSMTNELSTPKILACSSDVTHPPAEDWQSFGAGNLSYEFLAVSGNENEPTRVAARCLFHGNIVLCDGSAHMNQSNSLSQRLVSRNGKLYLE